MLTLSFFLAVAYAGQICVGTDSLCFISEANCATIHAKASGWAAFGIGTSMDDAKDIFFVTGTEARHLESTGYRQPSLKAAQQIGASPLLVPKPAWANTAVSFCFSSPTPLLAARNFIYAFSNRNPSGVSFSIHESKGLVSGDLSSNQTQTTIAEAGKPLVATDNYKLIIEIHGVMMAIAWFVAPILGIFIARYLKKFTWWYNAHVFLMFGVTTLVSLASFILIILYRQSPHFTAPTVIGNAHVKLGLAVMIGMMIQTPLGFVINALYDPGRAKIPWHDQLHWYLGRLVALGGIANTLVGIYFFAASYDVSVAWSVILWVVLGLTAIGFVAAEMTIDVTHHKAPSPTRTGTIVAI